MAKWVVRTDDVEPVDKCFYCIDLCGKVKWKEMYAYLGDKEFNESMKMRVSPENWNLSFYF